MKLFLASLNNNNQTGVFTFQSIQPSVIEQETIILKADVGSVISIDFNDGSGATPLTANGYEETHISNYTTGNETKNIILSGELHLLRKFEIINSNTISLNINHLKTSNLGINWLVLENLTGNITGSIDNLSNDLTYLKLSNIGSSITGSINNLPDSLVLCDLINHPLITGDINNFSEFLIDLKITDCDLISGNIDNFAEDTRSLYLSNLSKSIAGSIDNLPPKRLGTLVLENLGTGISGNINTLANSEWYYYDNINWLVIKPTSSTNSFTGSFSTLMDNNNRRVNVKWDVQSQRLELENLGDNITGDIKDIPFISLQPRTITIVNSGNLTYGGGGLTSYATLQLKIHTGLSTADLDRFINDFYLNSTVAPTYSLFDLAGNNAVRSSASDASVAGLATENRLIVLN